MAASFQLEPLVAVHKCAYTRNCICSCGYLLRAVLRSGARAAAPAASAARHTAGHAFGVLAVGVLLARVGLQAPLVRRALRRHHRHNRRARHRAFSYPTSTSTSTPTIGPIRCTMRSLFTCSVHVLVLLVQSTLQFDYMSMLSHRARRCSCSDASSSRAAAAKCCTIWSGSVRPPVRVRTAHIRAYSPTRSPIAPTHWPLTLSSRANPVVNCRRRVVLSPPPASQKHRLRRFLFSPFISDSILIQLYLFFSLFLRLPYRYRYIFIYAIEIFRALSLNSGTLFCHYNLNFLLTKCDFQSF